MRVRVRMRLACGARGEREASGPCDGAERVMRVGQIYDEEAARSLALLRLKALCRLQPTAAEMAALNNVVEAAQAEGGHGCQARAYRSRANVLSVCGAYRAEHADLFKCIDLLRARTATERMTSRAAMRAGFPTDRALARSAALDQQNPSCQRHAVVGGAGHNGFVVHCQRLGPRAGVKPSPSMALTLVSERDDLTDLPDRRKIIKDAEQQFALARRRRKELVSGMVDIDPY